MRHDSRVTKRCRHALKDQALCGCPFYYHVTHQGRKFRGRMPGAATFEEAQRVYAMIAARIRNGLPAFETTPTSGLTVRELGADWLALPRGRKASVIDSYGGHLRAHILPVLGARPVTQVTPEDCERFVLALDPKRYPGRPLAAGTRKSIARTLHALCSFAIQKRLRTDNPAAGLVRLLDDPDASPDQGAVDPKDHTKYFTIDEARHLLATCRAKFPEWFVFVKTLLETGCRLGEVLALTFDQIHWRDGAVTINRAWVRGRITSPKNGKSRTIAIDRELRALLRLRWRARRDGGLVFPSRVGTPIESSRIQRFWRELLSEAELGYRPRHACRHTHTSALLAAGVPIARVAAMAGRSVEETWRTYSHFAPAATADDASLLAGLLSDRKTHVSSRRDSSGSERPRSAANLRVVRRVS